MERQHRLVAIAGNIGAGKTSLAQLLEKYLGWKAFYEQPDENPYILDFYHDMPRWAFHLQIYFLQQRFNNLLNLQHQTGTVVLDRTIYEDAHIFARTLFEMGYMDERDYTTYLGLFRAMTELLPPPDLLIYLRASTRTLVDQITRRGRPYERAIRIDYLERLNEKYEAWIRDYMQKKTGPVIIINMDTTNFIDDENQRQQVLERITASLSGLFPQK